MSTLSTHVLDAVTGTPARGMHIALSGGAEGEATVLHEATTDEDGRVTALAPGELGPGTYRLRFDTGAYFAATGRPSFHPEVTVAFTVDDERHYHVPLLLSPYAYSTYRGS